MGALKAGDLVERVQAWGGHLDKFKVGDRAIVLRYNHWDDLIFLDNGASLYPMRVKKVEERKIKGDDDPDCI